MLPSLRTGLVLSLLACLGLLPAASENDWFVPLGPPPKAAPKRISGGESFPPLPLPATPLRRSERKKQPSPPALVGKLVWGEAASYSWEGGGSTEISDWNLCPGDLQGVLDKARKTLGVPYGAEQVSLAAFHFDPERLPVLFVSGVRTLRFSDEQAAKLRDYLLRGGTLVFDSVAGSPFFTDAARRAAAVILPDRPLRPVPLDHPLLHIGYDVEKAGFGRNPPGDRPVFEAAWVGSRCAVIISPYGLGCGWDDREVPLLKQAVFYDAVTSARLGVNLMAYCMGYASVGVEEAKPELFGTLDEKRPANELVFAQLRHGGHWDVHPGAAAALLARARRDSSLAVSLKRIAIDAASDDLSSYPFLYLTGVDELRFGERERNALRSFLARGGTLVADNGLGLGTFDAALRRELAELLPGSQLKPIPPSHPIFTAAAPLGTVAYTAAALKLRPGLQEPLLEGISLEGGLRVVYSPFSLASGWDGLDRPLARAWEPVPATAMGLNLLVYAVTH